MKRLAAAFGTAAAVVAGAVWWLHEPADVAAPPEPTRVLAHADVPAASPPQDSPAKRKLDELNALSESVRNSTFVIAIRAAGFVCEDVVDVYVGVDVSTWRARCRDSRAYYIRVADAGDLAVEPTLDYFDGVAPGAVEYKDRGRPDRPVVPPERFDPRR